jgi:hypothetical protein
MTSVPHVPCPTAEAVGAELRAVAGELYMRLGHLNREVEDLRFAVKELTRVHDEGRFWDLMDHDLHERPWWSRLLCFWRRRP